MEDVCTIHTWLNAIVTIIISSGGSKIYNNINSTQIEGQKIQMKIRILFVIKKYFTKSLVNKKKS